jgi:hypothetical protein
MVKYWCDIINSYPDNQTMLLFDSYYMDNSSRVILEQSGVKYLASFNPFRFKTVEEDLEPKVTKEVNGLACMIRQAVIQSSTIGLPIRSSEGSGLWEMLAKKLAMTIPQLRCPFSMSAGNVILMRPF